MFLIDCPTCGRRSMVGYSRLVGLANSSTGPVALVRCVCDEPTAVEYGTTGRAGVGPRTARTA